MKLSRPIKLAVLIIVIISGVAVFSIDVRTIPLSAGTLRSISTSFWGLFLQAFPFVLLGSLVLAIMGHGVGSSVLWRHAGRGAGSFLAPLAAALVLPVCDCAAVPVTASLSRRGLPLRTAVIYLLAGPIINPVVIFATLMAFPGRYDLLGLRIGAGVLVALLGGVIMERLFPARHPVLLEQRPRFSVAHTDAVFPTVRRTERRPARHRMSVSGVLRSAGREFFHMLPYATGGMLFAATFQTLVPASLLRDGFSVTGIVAQTAFLMLTGFILSVCSTADAFVARGFAAHFTDVSLAGFLVYGPMMDIKNMLVLMSHYRRSFVFALAGISFLLSLGAVLLLGLAVGWFSV